MGLSREAIERLAALEKEEWQRKVNQGVLKSDLNQSISALGAMEAVDRFLFVLTQECRREDVRIAEGRKVEKRIAELSPVPIRRKAAR